MKQKFVKDFLYEQESYKIRGAAFEVWKAFKGVFKEKVIERALKRELEDRGLIVETQKKIPIFYKGEKVGVYIPDLVINGIILIEIKVKPFLTREDERQFWYYLRGSSYKLGFLISFGSKKIEIKRRVYDRARKKYVAISVNQRTHQRSSASTKGVSLILAIIILAGMLSIALSISILMAEEIRLSGDTARSTMAFYAADTGIEEALSLFYPDGGTGTGSGSLSNGATYEYSVTGTTFESRGTYKSVSRKIRVQF